MRNVSEVMLRCEMLFLCPDAGGSSTVIIIAVVVVGLLVLIAVAVGVSGLLLRKRPKPGEFT